MTKSRDTATQDPTSGTPHDLIARAIVTKGGHLFIGFNGFTLFFSRGATLSGYDSDRMKKACIKVGLPVIDARTLPFETLFSLVVRNPMTAVGEESSSLPRNCLSYAPIEQTARIFKNAGAEVLNISF